MRQNRQIMPPYEPAHGGHAQHAGEQVELDDGVDPERAERRRAPHHVQPGRLVERPDEGAAAGDGC